MIWGLIFSAVFPIRQAYLNDMIPSKQRATVLSFDSLMSSSGGVVVQPILGRVADVYSYATSFVISGAIELLAVPFWSPAVANVRRPTRRLVLQRRRRRANRLHAATAR